MKIKQNSKGYEPKLRFPEYRDAWVEKKLGSVAKLIDDRAGDNKYTLMSVTSGLGLVSQIEKFGREIAGNQYKNYYVIKKWDFAYNKSATKQYPEGYISMLVDQIEGAVPNSIFTCFRIVDKKTLPRFLDYLFHDNLHGKWLRNFIEVGARAHGSLSVDDNILFEMPIAFPTLAEQHKIVDCLTSLDDLISSESQKLEKLKDHKKGLMQNLFPAEEETVPKVRFKEFRVSGDWRVKPLRKYCEIKGGKRIPKGFSLTTENTGYPYIRVSDMYMGGVDVSSILFVPVNVVAQIKNYKISKHDLFITVAGTIGVVGKIPEELDNANLTENANRIIVKNIDKHFLLHYMSSDVIQKIISASITNNAQPKLALERIREFLIPAPLIHEQQKIADCLSSLDNIITAHAKKIDTLKSHKRGLMQQLFPSASEVVK